MNILIVTERTSTSRHIAGTARAYWPTDEITFVQAVPYTNIKFSYPRGLRMQDYPFVSAPRDSIAGWEEWVCPPLSMGADGALTPTVMSGRLFSSADVVVCACDPDHTGAYGFEVLMRVVFGDDRAQDCPAVRLSSMDEASIRKAFSERRPFGEAFGTSLAYGLMKRHFDWNWNVNSFAILGAALRRVGAPAGAPPLSKYSLQLLYWLRKEPPMREGEIVHRMQRWQGTGRYVYPQYQAPSLGSCASRARILENLLEADLLSQVLPEGWMGPVDEDRSPPYLLTVSERGCALLDSLHPDCEDPDLLFRLDAWCQQGEAARPAIDRYIRTFFGKQLRFQQKLNNTLLTEGK